MANKSKSKATTTKKTSPAPSITRIKASDLAPMSTPLTKSLKKTPTQKRQTRGDSKGLIKLLRSIGGYFKGAWFELRQVRWPNRRATWSLTAAVLIFTAFFVVLVVLLDILFKYLFQLILG